MKLVTITLFSFICLILNPVLSLACSDAGTASATQTTICNNSRTTLTLTNYIGAIQWQVLTGGNWTNATGTGSTTDSYLVSPAQTIDYRAVVTATGCAPDTSNIVTITVDQPPIAIWFRRLKLPTTELW